MIIMARASAERITEILNEESDLKNSDHPCGRGEGRLCGLRERQLLLCQGPRKGVPEKREPDHAGPARPWHPGGTGTSKTTLVQLIPRLYDATEGRVLVGGVDVRDYDMDALREQVAMVLQKNVLFSGTIKDQSPLGQEGRHGRGDGPHVQAGPGRTPLSRSSPDKYDTYIEQGGTNVSGGQKQRLCIARPCSSTPRS